MKDRDSTHGASEIPGITRIGVSSFKSLAGDHSFEIRPLTILAGANSSGKSSAMQPLLLLKQTLDASFDPGSLLLWGPHVRFGFADQALSRRQGRLRPASFTVAIARQSQSPGPRYSARTLLSPFRFEPTSDSVLTFRTEDRSSFELQRSSRTAHGITVTLEAGATEDQLLRLPGLLEILGGEIRDPDGAPSELLLARDRCFFVVVQRLTGDPAASNYSVTSRRLDFFSDLKEDLAAALHVPGLRIRPDGGFPVAAVASHFAGTFDSYVGSVVHAWERPRGEPIARLEGQLRALGLTSRIEARQIDASRIELWVGRTLATGKGSERDMVHLAHVGLGVSQVLPILVALLIARPGQLVYLEQPELHLHPRAQSLLAEILADAASRGVRVVAETHSSLLLLGVQALVAAGKLDPALVKLHWFQRDDKGYTKVTSADLDETGAYGEWPEDFGEVEMAANESFLRAVEMKMGLR